MSRIDELAAALDGHSVTDQEGEIMAETEPAEEITATPEPNEEETTTEEAPESAPTADVDEEVDEVEDESGKKYIPIERFNKVYGKMKSYERKLQEETFSSVTPQPAETAVPVVANNWDKADVLEVKLTYPQFDPKPDASGDPTNPEYSRELDELAYSYLISNPNMTPMKAAQKALKTFENLTRKEVEVRNQARKVKISASEAPLTSRNRSKGSEEVDPSRMSFKEKEEYLRNIGYFN